MTRLALKTETATFRRTQASSSTQFRWLVFVSKASGISVFKSTYFDGLRIKGFDLTYLRKGYARNDLIAPEDADPVGERHGAAVRAGSQKHAAAKTKVADPVAEGMVLIYSSGDEMYEWVRSCPR